MKKDIVNSSIASIAPSVTLGIQTIAKQMQAAGRKVYGFAAGEPDFDTPEVIKQAAIKALNAGETKYTAINGLPALCAAIAKKLEVENKLTYAPGQIVVSGGAKHSLFNVIMALCQQGDEVIIPSPFWLSYPEMVKVAGGVSVFVDCDETAGFKMTASQFERAITPRTKMVIINSPSNPVGIVYTEQELRAIAEVAVRRGVYIISDEIYEKMVYDDTVHASIGSFSKETYDLTVTVNGFSKAFAMTGWRLGYIAAPKVIVDAVSALQSHSTSAPATFAQFGAIEALKSAGPDVKKMLSAFVERRAYLYGRLTGIKGVTCVKPMGAFYMMPNIGSFGMDSVKFCERLLETEGVAAVPGVSFGTDKHIRLSYACSMDTIREGMDCLERFVGTL